MASNGSSCAALVLILSACASPGMPPGGPVDIAAPALVGVAPDSGSTGVTPRDVVFRFDEVVSERPAGAPTLDALVLISPSDGAPRVDWSRREISVRPRRGWRPNITYTVTLLPGLTDLRGNARTERISTVFSTGTALAQGRITGVIFDWIAAVPAQNALAEARELADTALVFVAVTDSAGQFRFDHLEPGSYTVRAILDQNRNRALDPGEAWDTTSVVLADTAAVELLAYAQDSTAARLGTVSLRDSVTLELTFDAPIDPEQQLEPANLLITSAEGAAIPVASVTRVQPAVRTGREAIAVRRPSRPPPARTLTATLALPITSAGTYRVRALDIRNLYRVPTTSERTLQLAPPEPAPLPEASQIPPQDTAAPPPAPPPPPPAPPSARQDSV